MEVRDLGQGHQIGVVARGQVPLVLTILPEEEEGLHLDLSDVIRNRVQGLVDGGVVTIASAVGVLSVLHQQIFAGEGVIT